MNRDGSQMIWTGISLPRFWFSIVHMNGNWRTGFDFSMVQNRTVVGSSCTHEQLANHSGVEFTWWILFVGMGMDRGCGRLGENASMLWLWYGMARVSVLTNVNGWEEKMLS